ncbi:hypothetical protein HYFRA_00008035 [Hymenoscyphus fraxineus]|uniref:BTB domain-containing protein n=1 Tax=Hymenoscyphus fraxineus TaxID=746836 RepID=A0A9N9KQI6_9HELO|nr:hypothetical protein HYFRA_00008035 [Hymenoscyphus fraxineus]
MPSKPQKRKSVTISDEGETEPVAKKANITMTPSSKFRKSSDFAKLMQKCYDSPRVIVEVEGSNFTLPKDLLCDFSPFFDRAFNGAFKEAIEGKVTLEETNKTSFEHVIHWMHMGSIAVPDPAVHDEKTFNEVVKEYIGFFVLADRLGIPGPFTVDMQSLTSTLRRGGYTVSKENMRQGTNLPKNHPVRQLLADSCIGEYVYSLTEGLGFRLEEELEELDGFGYDILMAFQRAAKGNMEYDHDGLYIEDPLHKGNAALRIRLY